MLQELFMNVLTMSLTAIPIIMIVLLARIGLKFAPKLISYVLWAVVLFRLLCPFAFEREFSFVPNRIVSGAAVESFADSYTSDIKVYEAGTTEYDKALEQGMKPATDGGNYIVVNAEGTKQAKTVGDSLGPVLTGVWLVGIAALVSYSFVSLNQLKKRLTSSVLYRGNVYLADHIDSPFVLGLVRPKIYLPSTMAENEYTYTILHELYHIKRKDHVMKLFAFVAVCLHWFNPLVWLAFVLAMTDMEMSCDEAVLSQMGDSVKAEYSISLLGFASGKRYVPATFLAFGEANPKARIKNVLKWKKPMIVFSMLAAILALVLGILCLSNPLQKNSLEKTSSIVANNNRNRWVAEDEEYIYFLDQTKVRKISKKNNLVKTIYEFEEEDHLVNAFEYFDGRLYFVTSKGNFISINTNGGTKKSTKFAVDNEGEMLEVSSPMPKAYVFGDDLYFIADESQVAYRVNTATLALEVSDYKIGNQYQAEDGTIFTKRIEDDKSRLYIHSSQGEETLFSGEDESVISSHYTNAYVFYQAFKLDGKEGQYDKLYLYRVDLDGNNKVLVKEMLVAETNGDVLYDNEYAYVYMNQSGYYKIDKETLEGIKTTDVYLEAEVSNGRYFSYTWSYFIESETAKTVDFITK